MRDGQKGRGGSCKSCNILHSVESDKGGYCVYFIKA